MTKHLTCVNGHDLCGQMLPGPECPYCEPANRRPKLAMKAEVRALLGDDYVVKSERGAWLAHCRYLRGLRAWSTPHSYGYLRLTDALQSSQRRLAAMRKGTTQ